MKHRVGSQIEEAGMKEDEWKRLHRLYRFIDAGIAGGKYFFGALAIQVTCFFTGGCCTGLFGIGLLFIISTPSLYLLRAVGLVRVRQGEGEWARQTGIALPFNALWVGMIAFTVTFVRNKPRNLTD